MSPDDARKAAETLRQASGVKPGDAVDAALREVEEHPPELTLDGFIQGLTLTWPKTRAGQLSVLVMAGLLVFLLVTSRFEVATAVFSILLWMVGVQREQRVMLAVAFGATQHMIRHATNRQISGLSDQIGNVQAGVDRIEGNPQGGRPPPDHPPT